MGRYCYIYATMTARDGVDNNTETERQVIRAVWDPDTFVSCWT